MPVTRKSAALPGFHCSHGLSKRPHQATRCPRFGVNVDAHPASERALRDLGLARLADNGPARKSRAFVRGCYSSLNGSVGARSPSFGTFTTELGPG